MRVYTRFTQEHGNEAAAKLVACFAALVRGGVQAHGGRVIELRGDEAMVVFSSARRALRAAVDLQMEFMRESESDPSLPLSVGIGLDAGDAARLEGGYRGDAVNLAARLCNLAGPGEILASVGVVYLGRRVQGISYEAIMQGRGRLVLLSGDPGIGKTRLVQEVTLKARHWGFLVATGRCY
ncbi:MAG: hypothetical protein NVSMB52_03380 [Chloroflexota bacterium]